MRISPFALYLNLAHGELIQELLSGFKLDKGMNQSFSFRGQDLPEMNDRPMIGVLTQPIPDLEGVDDFSSYMEKGYVTYLESAGARVVPIIFQGDMEKELAKIQHLNGIFYAGGDASGIEYWSFAKRIHEEVKRQNDLGGFYPQWGTCLGMQDLVTFEATAGRDALTPHRNEDQSTTISFLRPPTASQLFQNFTPQELDVLTLKDAAFYVHNYGFSPDLFASDRGISATYTATSQTKDEKGEWFVASVES